MLAIKSEVDKGKNVEEYEDFDEDEENMSLIIKKLSL